MDWADYLRDEAAKYRQLAETAEDLSINKSFSIWQRFVRRQPITSRIACRAGNVAMANCYLDGAPSVGYPRERHEQITTKPLGISVLVSRVFHRDDLRPLPIEPRHHKVSALVR